MSIGKWVGGWVGKWFGRSPSSNSLQGYGSVVTSNWVASLDVVARTIDAVLPAPTSQGTGPGITSRNSDPHAYDLDRVAQRIRKVVIAGREYDPFDATLADRLDDLAKLPPPDIDDEVTRQDEKLSRFFEVETPTKKIKIPLFRPLLEVAPKFSTATDDDFERYKEKAEDAINEERRRLALLLSEF